MAWLDDYDVILGMEFLRWTKASVVLYLEGVQMLHNKGPCWVLGVSQVKDEAPQMSERA